MSNIRCIVLCPNITRTNFPYFFRGDFRFVERRNVLLLLRQDANLSRKNFCLLHNAGQLLDTCTMGRKIGYLGVNLLVEH